MGVGKVRNFRVGAEKVRNLTMEFKKWAFFGKDFKAKIPQEAKSVHFFTEHNALHHSTRV